MLCNVYNKKYRQNRKFKYPHEKCMKEKYYVSIVSYYHF